MIPQTTLSLCQGVQVTRDFSHTMTFPDATRQADYFRSKILMTFTEITYQRLDKSVKVPCNADLLRSVNYMMFKNENYTDKWFYAFVDSVEYLSPQASSIHFTIDPWQSYYFQITWKNCMIAREHVSVDSVALNRIDEGIDIGTVETISYESIDDLEDLCVIVAVTKTPAGVAVEGSFLSGVYAGTAYYYFVNDGAINAFLADYITSPDSVKVIFMMPTSLLGGYTYTDGDVINVASMGYYLSHSTTKISSGEINGYTPINKKCYQYPYNYLEVSNQQGSVSQFAYEDWNTAFSTTDCIFQIFGNIAPSPTVYLIPSQYKNSYLDSSEMSTLSGYPLCTWTYDAFSSWLAQHSVTNALSVGTSILSIASGAMTKSPMAIASGVMGFAETIGGFYEKSLQANPLKGSATGGGNISAAIQNFRLAKKAITPERMKIIDNYFTMYGYKVNRMETPNILSRDHWNYLQVSEANILGAMPMEHMETIRSTLRNGITFWHDEDVCNYNRSNAIV